MPNTFLSALAVAGLVAVPVLDTTPRATIPTPAPWTPPSGPPASCGRPVWIAEVLPSPERGGDGEWLVLVNPSPIPLELKGFTLRSGRRSRPAPLAVLVGGAHLRIGETDLGSMRLRNADGSVTLIDPCGDTVETATWGATERGDVYRRGAGWETHDTDGAR